MARPENVSAIPANEPTTKHGLQRASFDPEFSVDVVESLVYEPIGGTLNRMVQPVSANQFISANITGGSITTAPLSADSSSVSAIQGDAGKLRVSSLGGTFSLSADASGNRVSALSDEANQLHVSAFSNDAGKLLVSARLTDKYVSAFIDNGSISAKSGDANQFHVSSVQGNAAFLRVSAIGGTAGDNILVDGSDQTLSATIQRVSGSVSSGANALINYIQNRDDASNVRVSAKGTISAFINEGTVSARQGTTPWNVATASGNAVSASQYGPWSLSAAVTNASIPVTQSGTWSLSSLLTEGTAFAGNVSATVKNYPLVVSGQISANIDSGSVSAKSNDADQFRVSTLSKDAGLNRVSAIGGTAGDNTLVDGTDQSISARLIQVSANVSSSFNTLLVRSVNEDAGDLLVSASLRDKYVSATLDSGSVSAKQGTYPWSISGNISAALNEGTNFLGNVSATIKNYPLNVSGTISSFINAGSVSAKSNDADQLRISTFSKDAATFRVSAIGGTAGDNTLVDGTDQTLSATIQRVSGVVSSGANALNVYAQNRDDASNLRVSSRGTVSAFINEGTVSARQGTSPWIVSGTIDSQQVGTWSLSALLKEGSAFAGNVSATIKNYPLVVSGQVSANIDSGSVSAKSGDANQLHVSSVQGDAGLLRVSSIGGSFSLSADAAGNRVSALSDEANQLHVSAFSNDAGKLLVSARLTDKYVSAMIDNGSISAKSSDAGTMLVSTKSGDAGLMRVSAVGGTAGDNVLVDGSDQTVSAKLIQVSAAVSSNMNSLVARMTSYDAANARVSALQSGTWSLTALLTDSTANVGVVSAKSPDAGTFHVSSYSGDAGQMLVSARLTDKYVSATIDNGSVSAKSSDANQFHVSTIQGDAGLLHVSAIGGTAGDNILVDGTDQTLSATIQRVSGSVSSGANALIAYVQNRDDASNVRVSAKGTISAFINEGTVSARQGTYPWSVSGNVSTAINEGSNFLGQISETIKNYPLVVSGTISAFVNQGTISAYSPDAGLFHVSAIGGTAGDNTLVDGTSQTLSATLQRVSGTVSSGANALVTYPQNRDDAVNLRVSALSKDGGTFLVSASGGQLSALLKEGTGFIGQVSANQAGNWAISALGKEGTAFLGNVSATIKNYPLNVSGTISAFVNEGTVSARQGTYPWSVSGNVSAALNEGSNFLGQISATIKNYPLVVSGTVSTFLSQGTVSAIQPDANILHVSAGLFPDANGGLAIFRSLSLSASQTIKSTGGSLYGYFAWNTDTKPNYIKFTNTSGAINVGTDVPFLTICLPASAAANVEYPHGLITNAIGNVGLGIYATSAVADNATTPAAASAVGIDVFYK